MVFNMIEKISLFFFLFISTCSFSQMKGVVHGITNEKQEVLIGAKLRLLHAKIGLTTNEEGQFRFFAAPGTWTLVVQAPGARVEKRVIASQGNASDTVIHI